MSNAKRSAALQGIEVRTDAKGRKRYRGTAHDKSAGKYLRGRWTGSLAEARAWRVDAQAGLQAGTLSAATGPTVAETAEEFIAGMKSGTFRQKGGHTYKPSAIRGYERDLNNHAMPELGSKRISRLQRPELQRWVDGLTIPERSPSTVRNAVAALRALIGFAELRGWVHLNPCNGLRVPSGEKARDRIASPTEAAALIAAMRPTDRATLGCAVYAGLRLGELLALDVPAIDLEGGWIHVHRSWERGSSSSRPSPASRAAFQSSTSSPHSWPTISSCSTTRATACSFRAPTSSIGRLTRASCAAAPMPAGRRPASSHSDSTRDAIPTPALASLPV